MCLTGNGDMPQRECISSPGMEMCLTGIGDVPHRECTSSPGMHILTGNAHSLYRMSKKCCRTDGWFTRCDLRDSVLLCCCPEFKTIIHESVELKEVSCTV